MTAAQAEAIDGAVPGVSSATIWIAAYSGYKAMMLGDARCLEERPATESPAETPRTSRATYIAADSPRPLRGASPAAADAAYRAMVAELTDAWRGSRLD